MSELTHAVERLVAAIVAAPDAALDRQWAWQAYDGEGVRFAVLRSAEELYELAARITAERVTGAPPSIALTQLGYWNAAYQDMRGALLGVSDADADRVPAPEQWSLRQVLSHVIQCDFGFFVGIGYALDQHRSGNADPSAPPEAFWQQTLGDEAAFDTMLAQPLSDLLDSYGTAHDLITMALSGVTEDEITLPSRYWEPEPYPIGFRLGRFGSHTRQHIVQVDGIRQQLGLLPTEAQRVCRQLYGALAAVESALLGLEYLRDGRPRQLAQVINARADEVRTVVDGTR